MRNCIITVKIYINCNKTEDKSGRLRAVAWRGRGSGVSCYGEGFWSGGLGASGGSGVGLLVFVSSIG